MPNPLSPLASQARYRDTFKQFADLRHKRDALEDEIQRLEWALAHGTPGGGGVESVAPSTPEAAKAAQQHGGNGNGSAGGAAAGGGAGAAQGVQGRIKALERERDEIRQLHRQLLRDYHSSFHHVRAPISLGAEGLEAAVLAYASLSVLTWNLSPFPLQVWGQLMKTGYQNSRFANQARALLCLHSLTAACCRFRSNL